MSFLGIKIRVLLIQALLLHRYGLMGVNGCGKSTLLACLGNREVPIQDHIDIYYLARYIDITIDMTHTTL